METELVVQVLVAELLVLVLELVVVVVAVLDVVVVVEPPPVLIRHEKALCGALGSTHRRWTTR